jgi:hypothetical protein
MPNDDILVRAKEWVDARKQYSMAAFDIELVSDLIAELTTLRAAMDRSTEDYDAELEGARAELTKAREERDANKKLVAELNEMALDVVIGSLAATAGCTLEWSSGHEHGECIAEALAIQQDAIAVRDREIAELRAKYERTCAIFEQVRTVNFCHQCADKVEAADVEPADYEAESEGQ